MFPVYSVTYVPGCSPSEITAISPKQFTAVQRRARYAITFVSKVSR
jgi:hypothetical protein